ncbi:proteasome subunit alpha [Candidatus Poribacteria bacterium]|nr:proteasome subunit alpha [Candidatus Poribacteria bacterium]
MNHKGDFLSLLKNAENIHLDNDSIEPLQGKNKSGPDAFLLPSIENRNSGSELQIPEATTVVAMRYKEGIIIAGDRRATAGTAVVHDRAEKVIPIDSHSALAISGAPAMAFEIARVLKHSFQYFRRSQLQELSVEGKLRTLSRLIRDNLPMAMQGIGAVIPIYALYSPLADESENGGKIYFYDALGAHFENVDFATTGSGSIWIRGVLRYLDRWGDTQLEQMDQRKATITILRLLDTASEYDAATSGYNAKAEIFPTVKTITQDGIESLEDEFLSECYAEVT